MENTNHPTREILCGFAASPGLADYDSVRRHISSCQDCQEQVNRIKSTLGALEQVNTIGILPGDSQHLSDEIVSQYVNNTLAPEDVKTIKVHLAKCGNCMKQVLLYQTHLSQHRQPEIDAISQSTTDYTDNPISMLINKLQNRWLSWVAVPVAITALLAIVIVNQFTEQKADSPPVQIAKPDSVTNVNPADGLSPDGVTPVNQESTRGISNGINWYEGYIETTAIGTVDMAKMKNKVHAESTAELTARIIAYSQLAEIIEGVYIHKQATVKDLLLQEANITLKNEGFIKGAMVVDKTIEWVDDVPKATITLRAPIYGDNSLDDFIRRAIPVSSLVQQDIKKFNPGNISQDERYSGVIINAMEADYRPAVINRIVTDDGREILSSLNEQETRASIGKSIQYFPSLNKANTMAQFGNNPLILNAVSLASSEPGTVVISAEDANQVASILFSDESSQHQFGLVF